MKFFRSNNEKNVTVQHMTEREQRMYHYSQGWFDSKARAFDYYHLIECKPPEEAERLASIIAQARGVPDVAKPKPTGIEKAKSLLKEVQTFASENPKITEFGLGLLGGFVSSLGGVGFGAAVANASHEQSQQVINIDTSAEVKDID